MTSLPRTSDLIVTGGKRRVDPDSKNRLVSLSLDRNAWQRVILPEKRASGPARQPRCCPLADENILQQTGAKGIYRPSKHMEPLRETMPRIDHERHVKAHVRRLEALRRNGIVERLDADRWTIPADFSERGLAYDRQRFGKEPRIETLSDPPLDRQVRHEGTTWLDRTMIGGGRETMPHKGFGGDVCAAWNSRKRALADMRYAEDRGQGHFHAPKDIIAQLERADIGRVGNALATGRGLSWQPSAPGEYVSGKLIGSIQIARGRFAMIDNGPGFKLVPWADPLEKRLGKQISGVAMASGGVDWSFGRKLGLGL